MVGEARQRVRIVARSLFTLLVLGLAATSLLLLVHAYLVNPSAFNSDNLLCSAVCDDLLHGREVTSWHLPGAPYVFPDLLLLVPCHLLAPNIALEFLAYCFVFHLCLFAVLAWLGRLTGLTGQQTLAAAGCGVMLLALVHLDKNAAGRFSLLVHPGSHGGAILMGLFLLTLSVRSLRFGSSWPANLVFLLFGAAATFSDKLLAAQFLAPLAIALILLTAGRGIRVKWAGRQLALLSACVLGSSAIKRAFLWLGFHLLNIDTLFFRFHLPDLFSLLRQLYHGIEHEYLLCILIPLHLLAALLALRGGFRSLSGGRQPPERTLRGLTPPAQGHDAPQAGDLDRGPVALASLTFLLSPVCIIGTLFLTHMGMSPAIERYTLSCWFLPCLLLPLLLYWLPGQAARMGRGVVQLSIVLFAVQQAAVLLPAMDRGAFEPPYPPLARELDRLARQRGSLRGLGGFWLARSTNWFTRERVVINPLSPMAEPWFHASNPARFLPEDREDLREPEYHFLLVRPGDPFSPPAAVLALTFGTPVEKIAVGSDEIWLYDRLRSSPLDRFVRSRLAERLHAQRPFTGPFEPAGLARPKANLTPADARGNIALPAEGLLEVRFAQPVTGKLLDVGADFDNRLRLDFYRGEERLGSLSVPAVPWTGASYEKAGIQSRLLPLTAVLREREWDRILVRPQPGSGTIHLAHLLVFAESVPGVEDERPTPCPLRMRLEGESLLPLNPGTPFQDDADPSASGGRVRRAAVDFPMPFGFTPYLFLPPGRYRLQYAVQVGANASADEVGTLHVLALTPPGTLAERRLYGTDFPSTSAYILREITFEVAEGVESIQFGISTAGKTPIALDYIDLIPEPPHSSPGGR